MSSQTYYYQVMYHAHVICYQWFKNKEGITKASTSLHYLRCKYTSRALPISEYSYPAYESQRYVLRRHCQPMLADSQRSGMRMGVRTREVQLIANLRSGRGGEACQMRGGEPLIRRSEQPAPAANSDRLRVASY